MHGGVQGLHSAPQHLWVSSQIRHVPAERHRALTGQTPLWGAGGDLGGEDGEGGGCSALT